MGCWSRGVLGEGGTRLVVPAGVFVGFPGDDTTGGC